MRKQIRIPTIIGLLLIIIGIFITTFLLGKATKFLTRATPTTIPKNVRLTNLSDTKFTISFITEEPTVGFLSYGSSKTLGNIVFDDRDSLSGKTENRTTHYFTVSNLKPETTYYFKIGAGQKLYGAADKTEKIPVSCLDFLEVTLDGEPFSLKTLPSKMVSCRDIPLNGEVTTPQRLPAFGAIVCLEIENLLPLSDYVKSNGKWVIPCYNLALSNGQDFLTELPDGLKETIYIDAGRDGESKVINKTGNDNPVPLIVLGKETYDFTQITPVLTQSFITTPTAHPTTVPLVLDSPQGTISDDLPTFRGKGKPKQILKIEVRSETPLSATVIVDENGNWSWTPPSNLPPGEHTVTITAIDEYGNQQLITRTFTVAGSNPLLPITYGTPAATPTPRYLTISPTPTIYLEEPTPTTESGTLMDTANKIPIFLLLTFAIIFFTIGLRLTFLK